MTIDGRTYLRIGDAGQRHAYSTIQPWNMDGSLLHLYYGGHWLLDGHTYAPIRQISPPDRPQWSTTDPKVIYGTSGTRVVRYNVDTGSSQTILDTGRSISIGNGEGAIRPGNLIPLQDSSGNAAVVLGDGTYAHGWFGLGFAADSVKLSWDGRWLVSIVEAGTTGYGSYAYDLSQANPGPRKIRSIGNHADTAVSQSGRQVLVTVSPQVTMVDLETGQTTLLLDSPNAFEAGHVQGGVGWATVSPYGYQDRLGGDQVVRVKLDGSELVRFFGMAMHRGSDYLQEPMAVAAPDGLRVLVASDWGTSTVYPVVLQ